MSEYFTSMVYLYIKKPDFNFFYVQNQKQSPSQTVPPLEMHGENSEMQNQTCGF